jgi:hypothetical protein
MIIIKKCILKEGNRSELLDEATLFRSKALQIQNQSQDYQNLANEAIIQANIFIDKAIQDEYMASLEKDIEDKEREKVLRDEQDQIKAQELRIQELQNKEIEEQKIKQQIEYQAQDLQNQYQEANSNATSLQNSKNELKDKLEYINSQTIQQRVLIQNLIDQANQAQERNQEYWNNLAADLRNQANQLKLQMYSWQNDSNTIIKQLYDIDIYIDIAVNKVNIIKEKIKNL